MFQQYHKVKFKENNEVEYVSAYKEGNISLFLVVNVKDIITVYYSFHGEERGESRFTLLKDTFLKDVENFMGFIDDDCFHEKSAYGSITGFIDMLEDYVLVV